tara:strand:+ start:1352 stop:2071 length:720 start_codon:yes stop_codon:yes gene_type:complete
MEKRNDTHNYVSELRKRIIAIAVFFVAALVIGMLFSKKLVLIFLNSNLPENVNLITLNPYENISLFIHFTFFVAIALTTPLIIHQALMYLKPSLTKNERRIVRIVPFIVLILFSLGSSFGFFITKRIIVPSLSKLTSSIGIVNNWSVNQFLMFVVYLSLAMGLIFLMPLIISLLVKFNILKPEQLKKGRKHTIIGLLILAALITPPDIISLVIMVIPLILLFEITIFISKFMKKGVVVV